MQRKKPFTEMVSNLSAMGEIYVGDHVYDGVYLSTLVSLNPANLHHEATITPQLIAEIGRAVALAGRIESRTERDYRVWRDRLVLMMTQDIEAAKQASFMCAVDPGKDSRGKDKIPKCPSATEVERWLRTTTEYGDWWSQQEAAIEARKTLESAYEAAKARTWAIRVQDSDGGRVPESAGGNTETVASDQTYQPQGDNPTGEGSGGPGMTPPAAVPPPPPPPLPGHRSNET